MNCHVTNRNRGVTIIELMIVLAVIGILAGFAVPEFGGLMKRQSLLSESRRITSLLKVARSEARSRGAFITLSRSGADWSGDILVYENVDGVDGDYAPGTGADSDELVRTATGSGRAFSADSDLSGRFLTFSPRGWARQPISIAICSSLTESTAGRLISVNRVGKIIEGPIGNESCDK